ncbi:protein FAR1-RELATED SEQUENCE 5-like isoform X1 [Chenopodium quinoa]|uniref:protein FAR1-RELATED SEQUENCE 5-like isoform X1 n=1 Tax=Chenopodium quinoa TaxID=63459 RepID=UPI000B784E42|nr:protein FAR1-RELATED SEQUENCE 5-like isoform X1 [Chenopodium quinoa]
MFFCFSLLTLLLYPHATCFSLLDSQTFIRLIKKILNFWINCCLCILMDLDGVQPNYPSSCVTHSVGDIYRTPEVVGSFSPGGTTKEWIPSVPEELKPSLGMIFKDPEGGLSFYKAYANAAGFTSRKSTTKRKKNNKDIIAFQYGVCNKEGFRAIRKPIAQQTVYEEGKVCITRKRLVTRVGCNAHICMRYDAGKYVVTHFKEEHNHPLYTPSCAKFQKDNRKMHIMHKKLIVDNSKVNVGPVRSYTMMKELVGSHDNVGASKQDFKNFYRDLKAFIDGSDAQMFVDNFQNKKLLWSAFFFSYDVDEEDRLCRALWADPICRKNYALFGDMVSFDTTFKTNR